MYEVNLNGFDEIFTNEYYSKITILGVTVRTAIPNYSKKYSKKIIKHIYFKTHGNLFDLCEIFEAANEKRCRITLNKTSKITIPKPKLSKQSIGETNYYLPTKKEIHFCDFKTSAIFGSSCELFDIYFTDGPTVGILIEPQSENFKKVNFEELSLNITANI